VYSTDVTDVRDDLHNHGVEFAELNASVKRLESGPSDDELRHAALVLRAVADQLITMSQAPAPPVRPTEESKHEPLPEKVTFVVPELVKLKPYEFASYSRTAGRMATDIRVCLVDQQQTYKKNKVDAAAFCNSVHASSVSDIANGLRDGGVDSPSVSDAVKRMESGASFDELEYVADLMDLVSRELGKRAH
jgi:hypothetical protein